VSRGQLRKVESFIEDAVGKGAKILVGGKRIADSKGYYFLPTVLTDINPSMRLMNEECFGPVLPIVAVNNTQEAIDLTNDSYYGLGASVWTSDTQKGQRIASLLHVGMVWINDVNVAFPETPWGGVKKSGQGVELSEWGLYEYVHKKHINLETSKDARRLWWYPYSDTPDN